MVLSRKSALIVLMFLLCLGLSFCTTDRTVRERLDRADSLIMNAPDSALRILEEIDTAELRKPGEKAQYGLLYTMALDKNHLNPGDLPLIEDAADYYKRKGDVKNEIRACYYLGRVYQLNGDFNKALINYFTAKELSEKEQNYFYAGLACRGIADIFFEKSNFSDELIFAEKSFENFQKSGVQPYLNYAIYDLGRTLANNEKREEASKYINMALDSASLYNDSYLEYISSSLKARNLFWMSRYNESLNFYETFFPSRGGSQMEPIYSRMDSLFYSWVLAIIGEISKSENILSSVPDSEPLKNRIKYEIYNKTDRKDLALVELEKMNEILDSKLRKQNEFNFSSTLADYFETDKKLQQSIHKEMELKLYIIIILAVTGIIILILFLVIRKNQYNNLIGLKMNLIEELESKLNEESNSLSSSRLRINSLFKSKNNIISEFGEILLQFQDKKIAQKQIDKKIESIIEDLSTGGNLKKLMENEVNEVYDDIFTDFRRDFPNLKDKDYTLFLYTIIGFSIPAITLFMGENNVTAIYNRKKRLKEKIGSQSETIAKRYLEYL